MRKMKSLSSLKKRVRRTAGGSYVHRPCGTSHNNQSKSKSRKRRLHVPVVASSARQRQLKRLVPYC